jgi:tRNA pseudouridine38-40 synthase
MREGYSYLVTAPLDIEAMNRAAKVLIGEHDFASFASSNGANLKSTVRRVFRAEVERDGELVIFNMTANSFLLHQVRNTIGALIRVGLAKMSTDEFAGILEAREKSLAGPTAPACGLFLDRINYPRPFGGCDEDL